MAKKTKPEVVTEKPVLISKVVAEFEPSDIAGLKKIIEIASAGIPPSSVRQVVEKLKKILG